MPSVMRHYNATKEHWEYSTQIEELQQKPHSEIRFMKNVHLQVPIPQEYFLLEKFKLINKIATILF
jgi:hypothetical protein